MGPATTVRVCTTIDASPQTAWTVVERIESHVEWMSDAESIRFTTEQHRGPGTEFECLTRLGPIRVTDVMSITEWITDEAMGVEHRGMIRGTGRFTLRALPHNRTLFCWEERLTFPLWLGGPLGARLARPILTRIWQGNLRRLRRQVENRHSS